MLWEATKNWNKEAWNELLITEQEILCIMTHVMSQALPDVHPIIHIHLSLSNGSPSSK